MRGCYTAHYGFRQFRPQSSALFDILQGIGSSGAGKTGQTQLAAITSAACALAALIAAPRKGVVHSKLKTSLDRIGLAEVDQRRVDCEVTCAFDTGLGGQIGGLLERLNKLMAAIGLTAVIDLADANEDIKRAQRLRVAQRERKKDRIPSRDVGNRYSFRHCLVLTVQRHVYIVGKRAPAHTAKIKLDDQMVCSQALRHSASAIEFT